MAAPTSSDAPASATPEGLPDLTQVPEEERDAVWMKHYYRGNEPQLTVRAVITGGVLGACMAISNLYTTLKLGWAFGVAITACVLSFLIWRTAKLAGIKEMTILENNCMQSTASAAGYSTGGTLATAVGALLLVTGDAERMGWLPVTIWVALTAMLGVFIAIPMKRQMINSEQLPFPSGIAAAETLRSLYAKGGDSVKKALALAGALVAGVTIALVRDAFGLIPGQFPLGFTVLSGVHGTNLTGAQTRMWVEPSLLLIAAGMIVGIRISTWMFVGAMMNQFIFLPYAAGLPDWQQEGHHFYGHVEAFMAEDGSLAFVHITRWSLWLGTALLVASGLTSFALGYKTILRAIQKARGGATNAGPYRKSDAPKDLTIDDVEVPMSWFFIGMAPITIGLIVLCWMSFSINPLLGLLSVVLSFVLGLVACRATGETDTTPIGAMGKITQFTFAVLAPANITANLMTAGITAGAAGSAADLLTDLKSGYLLGANPRQQFIAQLSGVFFGVPAVVLAWYALVPDQAHLDAFGSPATTMWHAVAVALSEGIQTIPESARWAIVFGGIAGVVLSLVEGFAPKNVKPFVPSSMGLGLAFVVPWANAFSFFVGAIIAEVWMRAHKKSADTYLIALASGAIAGESLASAGVAIYESVGALAAGGAAEAQGGGS